MNLDPIIWQMLFQLILIALNAVFACAEIAVISMNENKLEQLAEGGDKRAICLAKLKNQPARFLATIQVAITLSGFMGSAFAADNFSDRLVNWIMGLGVQVSAATLDAVSVVVITLILSYFTLVLGELVPKRLAMKKAESLALGMAKMISVIAAIAAPIVWVLTASTNLILRLLGVDPNAEEDEVSEEEIRMMVDLGSRKGVINTEEKEMIQNIFEFNDVSVEEFATHRTELTLLWTDETVEQWEKTIRESRHSLYPVCEETTDHVIGILNAKDYFRLNDKSKENILSNVMKPAFFVPETICADVLFKQMKMNHNHFAVAMDEYGGVSGIVTMNDLLEQLVGDLEDEEAEETQGNEIESLEKNIWKISGKASLEDVGENLEVVLPIEEHETFGGFVFDTYGFIPEDGSQFELDIDSLHIEVMEIKDHRLKTAIVSLCGQ